MSYFQGAHHFSVQGASFNDYSVNQGLGPIQFLLQYSATGAAHDAEERQPPPRCHPQTRKRILSILRTWIKTLREERDKSVVWLYGPAGMGKSAIAQTIAEECEALGLLAASFFFNRANPQRNRAARLVASIALQLCESIPEIRPYVEDVMRSTPTILTKSLPLQLRRLVIEPLKRVPPLAEDRAVIIDGLDECLGPDNVDQEQEQALVLGLIDTLQSSNLPLIILLCSRPESWIKEGFLDRGGLWQRTNPIDLYDTSDKDNDVEVYLRPEFERIRRISECGDSWPSDEDITTLVQRASGQFIYAATVVRYVEDRYSHPQDRLTTILSTKTPEDHKPLHVLDDLYLTILRQTPNYKATMEVLGSMTLCPLVQVNELDTGPSIARFCQAIYNWGPGALRGLHSVININGDYMSKFYHTTFMEFLEDEARSGLYCTLYRSEHYNFIRRCLVYLAEASDNKSNGKNSTVTFNARLAWCSLWQHIQQFGTVNGHMVSDCLDALLKYDITGDDDFISFLHRDRPAAVISFPADHSSQDLLHAFTCIAKIRRCISNLRSAYDQQLLAELTSLSSNNRGLLRGLINLVFDSPSSSLELAGFTVERSDEVLNLCFEGVNLLEHVFRSGLVYLRYQLWLWNGGAMWTLIGALNGNFLTFLATADRSEAHGWYIFSQSQLVDVVKVCLLVPPLRLDFTGGSVSMESYAARPILELFHLIKSPEDVIPALVEFHGHCRHSAITRAEINDKFQPDLWVQNIAQCIFSDNVKMAIALFDFLEPLYRADIADPTLLRGAPDLYLGWSGMTGLMPLFEAFRRDPSGTLAKINYDQIKLKNGHSVITHTDISNE